MRKNYPWMNSWVLLSKGEGNEDQYGNLTDVTIHYATVPARVTNGDRIAASEVGFGILIFTYEGYLSLDSTPYLDYVFSGSSRGFVEVAEDIGVGQSQEYTGMDLSEAYDQFLIDYNVQTLGDFTTPNRRSIKRSMFDKNQGYVYIARTGAE